MEEKERYVIDYCDDLIFDTEKEYCPSGDTICKTLNQQDKELSKLRASYQQVKEENQQLIKALNGEVFINYKLPMENAQLKQSQKQLAIEELKLALENFRNRPTYFDVARQELCLSDQDKQFIDFINNRIKELKGEK